MDVYGVEIDEKSSVQPRRPGRPRKKFTPDSHDNLEAAILLASDPVVDAMPPAPKTIEGLRIENEKLRGELKLYRGLAVSTKYADVLREMLRLHPVTTEPGVYLLLDASGEVVYVGQSCNVAARMRGHTTKRFKEIKMISIEDEVRRSQMERWLITYFRPHYNVKLK